MPDDTVTWWNGLMQTEKQKRRSGRWLRTPLYTAGMVVALSFLLGLACGRAQAQLGFQVFAGGLCVAGVLLLVDSMLLRRAAVFRVLIAAASVATAYAGVSVFRASNRVPLLRLLPISYRQLRHVHEGLLLYQEEYSRFPASLQLLTEAGYVHPSELESKFRQEQTGPDYTYVAGLHASDPGHWPIVFDAEPVHKDGTRSVLLLSGEIEAITGRQFEELLETFRREFRALRGVEPTIEEGGGLDSVD